MTERPIIFSGAMVRAILEEKKTQTRRVVADRHLINKPRPPRMMGDQVPHPVTRKPVLWSPHGIDGDRMWVRETSFYCNGDGSWLYRADGVDLRKDVGTLFTNRLKWTPSIHMPRIACRLTLDVVAVRIERLQDCTEADARAEGIDAPTAGSYRAVYAVLWDSLNAKRGYGWSTNPWVWVIEFRRGK